MIVLKSLKSGKMNVCIACQIAYSKIQIKGKSPESNENVSIIIPLMI